MNWDHLTSQLTLIIVAVLGSGGVLVEWMRRKTKKDGPLDREEADTATAVTYLDEATQIVTAALVDRMNRMERDFNDKLDAERGERRRAVEALQRRYDRLHGWALDIVQRWDHHREQERPPVLPE